MPKDAELLALWDEWKRLEMLWGEQTDEDVAEAYFHKGEAKRLAIAGETDDPAKAIEDMRSSARQRVEKSREKGALRNAPTRVIEVIEDDTDQEADVEPGQMPDHMRTRGFIYRAMMRGHEAPNVVPIKGD